MAENNEIIDEIFLEFEEELEKATAHLKSEYLTIRAGRANPHVLDRITVDYYGSQTPLAHVSNIMVQDARTIVISPWDQSLVKEINKAIQASDLGVNPSDDGRVVRLSFPMLTEDRRKELVKGAYKIAEETKVACRNARRDALEQLKKLKKDGSISEDDMAGYEKDVQKTLDKEITKIDTLAAEKEKDIMQV